MGDHATLSASKASAWMNCYGVIAMTQGAPNTSSKFADEGTAAHALAERCLTSGQNPAGFIGERIDGGMRTFEITDDMAGHVQTYLDHIEGLAADGELHIECQVDYTRPLGLVGKTVPHITPDGEVVEDQLSAFGTSDAIIVRGSELIVVDLKYGMGVKVDAQDNEQLLLYAVGAYEEHSLVGEFDTVRTVIVQPRLNHISEAVYTIDELKEFTLQASMAADHVIANLKRKHKADDARMELSPGEKQCRWCAAKATCPALLENVKMAVASAASPDDFEDVSGKPLAMQLAAKQPLAADLGIDALSQAMKAVDLVEMWCKGVRAETERRLLEGQAVDGFKIVEGKMGNRVWANAAEAEEAMKAMRLKIDEMYDRKVISPTSAEKLLKSTPRKWAKLADLITRSAGAKHVAPASDPRPALNITPVADDFDDVTSGEDLV